MSAAKSYTCPTCGMMSHHPEDVRQRYCGRCFKFEGQPVSGAELVTVGDELARLLHQIIDTGCFEAEIRDAVIRWDRLRAVVGEPR